TRSKKTWYGVPRDVDVASDVYGSSSSKSTPLPRPLTSADLTGLLSEGSRLLRVIYQSVPSPDKMMRVKRGETPLKKLVFVLVVASQVVVVVKIVAGEEDEDLCVDIHPLMVSGKVGYSLPSSKDGGGVKEMGWLRQILESRGPIM
ncbi:hypothetical protein Tco_1148721, partial [Tanacetum coccineum]